MLLEAILVREGPELRFSSVHPLFDKETIFILAEAFESRLAHYNHTSLRYRKPMPAVAKSGPCEV